MTVQPEADRYPSGWRKFYLFGLLALFAAQTLFRLISRDVVPKTTWISTGLHLWVLAFYALILVLVISWLPRRLGGYPFAAPVTAILIAGAHTIVTVFDIVQFLMQHYAAMAAPVWLIFLQPRVALSLVASMGITPIALTGVVAGLFAVHLLLYAPVAADIAALARRSMAARVRMPQLGSVPALWPAAGALAALVILSPLVPSRFWRREWFHSGTMTNFQVAPAELMHSADSPPPPIGPRRPLPGARPLILIIVDAMRRDRMGVYNPAFDNTPFLSGMAKAGTLRVFNPAYSTCTFSACGIMSVLSSRSWDSFGKRPATFFDALARYGYHGYVIFAGHNGDMGNLTRLFGAGIDSIREQGLNERLGDASLIAALRQTRFADPSHSVLYLHLVSTHAGTPLLPRFRSPGTSPNGDFAPTPDSYSRLYNDRVRQADDFLAQVFAVLRDKHLLDHALVVMTADHGERLGEHGLFYHGGPPGFAATAIPLMVYDADKTVFPQRAMASQIDIAPTFLRAVGGEYGSGWRGQALQDPARTEAVPIGTYEATGVVAMVDGNPYKYLCTRASGEEHVERIDNPNAEGTPVPLTPATRPLLDRLRALDRAIAGAAPQRACRH